MSTVLFAMCLEADDVIKNWVAKLVSARASG
jgi:hypothetical protein